MRVQELAFVYALVGLGCALATLVRGLRAGSMATVALDAVLLVPFWPLYGPFLLSRAAAGDGDRTETDRRPPQPACVAAIERASGTPLAALLPDAASARFLEGRLARARNRVSEIDQLLGQPEFSERAAFERQTELARRGDERAAATARARLAGIRRLGELRGRFVSELAEIEEILAQLRVQAEVVRLAGDREAGASRELLGELVERLEALDEMLGEAGPASSAS